MHEEGGTPMAKLKRRVIVIVALTVLIILTFHFWRELNPPENFTASKLRSLDVEEIASIDTEKGQLTQKDGTVIEAHGLEDRQTLKILLSVISAKETKRNSEVALDTSNRSRVNINDMEGRIYAIDEKFSDIDLTISENTKSFSTNDFEGRYTSRYVYVEYNKD